MVKILLAEDEKNLNTVITSYIKTLGCDVISVHNGLDALNVFYDKRLILF